MRISNALSFNFEQYSCSRFCRRYLSDVQCQYLPNRLEPTLEHLLQKLEQYQSHATFFALGELAQQNPVLIRCIAGAGHELACQTMSAQRLIEISPQQFQKQLQQSKTILEDISGQSIIGFRASGFSMMRETLWSLDIIAKLGFEYDSSIFPISHENFGIPEAQLHLHYAQGLEGARILEFPPLTAGLRKHRFPIGASPYLRFIPASWVRRLINYRNRHAQPIMLCFDTWEFDPAQPRLPLPFMPRLLHYHNLSRSDHKLAYYLKHHRFAPIRQIIKEHPVQTQC